MNIRLGSAAKLFNWFVEASNWCVFCRCYTNCIYFLVQLKNKYAMVNADSTWN
jgi:hypothetical protein